MNLIGLKQLKKSHIPNYKVGESPTFYLVVMIKCIRVYKNINGGKNLWLTQLLSNTTE